MKVALVGIVVVVLMAAAGGAGYYFGDQSGFTRAQSIRNDFIQQRVGTQATGTESAQGAQAGQQRSAGQQPPQAQRGAVQTVQAGTPGGLGAQAAALFGGRPVASGAVKSIQGNTITVTQADGSSTNITVNDKTVIQKFATGTMTDIQNGARILVTEQTTGNTTFQQIQVLSAP